MTRLNWERLRLVGKAKLSIADESNFDQKDKAARWLNAKKRELGHQTKAKAKTTAKH
jgi:hypothetical protein